MIKAIIFDCFGVVLEDALRALSSELQVSNPEAVSTIWSLIDKANKDEVSADESSTRIAEIFGLTLVEYRTILRKGELKNRRLLDYIIFLRESYKTAMLSNIPKGSLERRFASGELDQYFDVVVASGEIGYAKPEPEAYEITADRLGVRLDECVFIDDREPYYEGAKAVGMQGIIYKDFTQFKLDLEKILSTEA